MHISIASPLTNQVHLIPGLKRELNHFSKMWYTHYHEDPTGPRVELLQSWTTTPTATAPKALLPDMQAYYLNSLPSPYKTGLHFGYFFGIAVSLPHLMAQGPDLQDLRAHYNLAIRGAVTVAYLEEEIAKRMYVELNHLVIDVMDSSNFWPDMETAETRRRKTELLPSTCSDDEKMRLLVEDTICWEGNKIFLHMLIDTHLPLFRARWTDAQFNSFINGFERASDDYKGFVLVHDPNMGPFDPSKYRISFEPVTNGPVWTYVQLGDQIPEPSYFENFSFEETTTANEIGPEDDDDDDDQYVPDGPRIHLDAFCRPAPSAPLLSDIDCVICNNSVTTLETGDETVVTACQHYYHAECLTSWVNDSAVRSSNTCPQCRTVMCEARATKPVENVMESGSDYIWRYTGRDDEIRRYLDRFWNVSEDGGIHQESRVNEASDELEDYL